MSQFRPPAKSNKYYLPKETYLTVIHYARQYPHWVQELSVLPDSGGAIRYDKDKVQTSNTYDANAELAMRRYEISKKKEMVEQLARQAAPDMYEWLLKGIGYGYSYWDLHRDGIPCSKNTYYERRAKFYYLLSKNL